MKWNQVKQFSLCLSTKQFNFNDGILPKAFQTETLLRDTRRLQTAFSKSSLLSQKEIVEMRGGGMTNTIVYFIFSPKTVLTFIREKKKIIKST